MAPPSDEDQTSLGYRLRTKPAAPVTSYRDGFGNRVDLFNVATPYQELVVQATSFVRTHRRPGVGAARRGPLARRRARSPSRRSSSCSRARWSTAAAALDAFVAEPPRPSGTLADVAPADDGRRRRAAEVREEGRRRRGRRSSEALALGRGVCQDFAHLFLGACRGLGLPARYVSGYVNHPGEVATHAWCQVWAGEAGRLGRRRPDHGRVRRRRPRRDGRRPRLLRRPAQPRRLEGPGRGDDRRHRQGRAGRPGPAGVERMGHAGPLAGVRPDRSSSGSAPTPSSASARAAPPTRTSRGRGPASTSSREQQQQ